MLNNLPFRTLLYRYFFFAWMFKDVEEGTMFERAAAVRYNREQARWLPVYVIRWLWLALLWYALAGFLEIVMEAGGLAVLFYAASAICASFTITIATAWVGIRLRHRVQ
jgi:hypothetical protein